MTALEELELKWRQLAVEADKNLNWMLAKGLRICADDLEKLNNKINGIKEPVSSPK